MIRPATPSVLTRLAAAMFALMLLPALSYAEPEPAPAATPASDADAATPADAPDDAPTRARQMPTLHYQQGKITLSDGLAELNVPDNFRFLNAPDARKVVVNVWGNPPEVASNVIGLLIPTGMEPNARESWGVVISYESEGYVKDDDANKINYQEMLTTMQKSIRDGNDARVKAGYPAMELVGWAEPPQYDAATKKLFWAKELSFGDVREHTLNYDMRILGRRGVLILRAVAGMDQLEQIKEARSQILGMVNYNQGHRYADFNPKTDKVAAYGVAALVLGGIAAKAGLFKLMIPVLLAAKKFIIIGVVAVASFFKRIFGRGEKVK